MKKSYAFLLAIVILAFAGCGSTGGFTLPSEIQGAVNVTDRICTNLKEPIAKLVQLVDEHPDQIPEKFRDDAVRIVAEYKARKPEIQQVCAIAASLSTKNGEAPKPIVLPSVSSGGGSIDFAKVADVVATIAVKALEVQAARSK